MSEMMMAAMKSLNLAVLGNGVGTPERRELRRVRYQRCNAAMEKTMFPTPWITIPASWVQVSIIDVTDKVKRTNFGEWDGKSGDEMG